MHERNWFCWTVLWQIMIPQFFRDKELIYKTVNCLCFFGQFSGIRWEWKHKNLKNYWACNHAILITYWHNMEVRNKNNCHTLSGLQITDHNLKKARISKMKLLHRIIWRNRLGKIGYFTERALKFCSVK